MIRRFSPGAGVLALAAVALAALGARPAARAGDAVPAAPAAADVGPGTLYDRFCLACHGALGDGRGPAAALVYPKPRDFTKGLYRFRSTPLGQPPTDEDLARAIREGAPGTSMPGFGGILSEAEIAELVQVVKRFAPKRFARAGVPIAVPAAPAAAALADPARVTRGAELFKKAGCATCHGEQGSGDGGGARDLKDEHGRPVSPRDLARDPLKRAARGAADLWLTIATGVEGANMPGVHGALPADDIWALVGFVLSLRKAAPAWQPGAGPVDPRGVEPWSFGWSVPAQGEPPAALPPAAASLSAQQCARCHAKQEREWRGSLHAKAMSPGTVGQFVGAKPGFVASCQKCHAPLAEQLPGAAAFDRDLRAEAVNCASCHVRAWTRRGPPRAGDSKLLGNPAYPFVVDASFERSDLCAACHQLPPAQAVAGRPLLDTYREWLEGPYMRRGVQCQHCHMPDREHTWKGIHDPATLRQGVDLDARASKLAVDRFEVRVVARNVGAGHFLPTTPTPALWIDVELLGDGDKVLATQSKRIGRDLRFEKGKWRQVEDTRIPPGQELVFVARFAAKELKAAKVARVRLRAHPDDYYEGFYGRLLKGKLAPEARKQLEEALARTIKSRYVAIERRLSLVD